jgi:VWFA-related protein
MKFPMRIFLTVLLLAGLAAAQALLAQDLPAQDLPAAPSAAKTEAARPAPPQSAPAQPPASQPAAAPQPAPATTTAQPLAPVTNDDVPDAGTTIIKRVDEVNVIFTVTDKSGRFVKGLRQTDFSVFDDKKPPQSMVAFRSETNLPLRAALLIDSSNSIRDRFNFELEASAEFLSQTIRPKVDRAIVYGFDSVPDPVVENFTDSTEAMVSGLRRLRPGGGTAVWDIVYNVCREKLGKLDEPYAVRRVIVLISDGDDNQSRVTRQEAIEMAQRSEVIVYAISTNISNSVSRGDKSLTELAEATGGRVFFPMKLDDIAEKFVQIQEELRSQYAVAYKPTDFQADGRYRAIDILAANKKYKVRARKGYYAPRQ